MALHQVDNPTPPVAGSGREQHFENVLNFILNKFIGPAEKNAAERVRFEFEREGKIHKFNPNKSYSINHEDLLVPQRAYLNGNLDSIQILVSMIRDAKQSEMYVRLKNSFKNDSSTLTIQEKNIISGLVLMEANMVTLEADIVVQNKAKSKASTQRLGIDPRNYSGHSLSRKAKR